MSDRYYSETQKYYKIHNEFIEGDFVNYDDFVFSNKDTFAVVLLLVYKKNDEIQIFDSYDVAQELSKVDEVSAFDDRSDVKVTHKISVSGLRMLYTLNIEYLFYHHFFENFNLEEYKKADYMNLNTSTNYDPFANYKKYDKFERKNTKLLEDLISENSEHRRLNNILLEDIPGIKKELFLVLEIDRPQFNFQDEVTKSQLLVAGKGIMRVSLYNFLMKDQFNPRKKYSIKKQIMCRFDQINAYVAPTTINIVSPTFWCTDYASDEQVNPNKDEEIYQMENLLRQIMKTKEFHFDIDIFHKEFCNYTKPLLNLSIMISDTKAWFTTQNWWIMINVIRSILLSTGEKSQQRKDIDEFRSTALDKNKPEILKTLIHRQLKKMVSQFDINNRPMIDKKIVWEIKHAQMELFEDNLKFSDIELVDFSGHFMLYSNKDTKCDVDIHRIVIENFCDPEAYRLVLYPGYSLK